MGESETMGADAELLMWLRRFQNVECVTAVGLGWGRKRGFRLTVHLGCGWRPEGLESWGPGGVSKSLCTVRECEGGLVAVKGCRSRSGQELKCAYLMMRKAREKG